LKADKKKLTVERQKKGRRSAKGVSQKRADCMGQLLPEPEEKKEKDA